MHSVLPSAQSSADALLELARASVQATGSGSVARLQQDLGLGYGIAAALADRLEAEGTLLSAHGDRPRMLHPRFLRQRVRDVSGALRPRYVNRLVALALFFFECHEEGHVGDSRIPALLSPVQGIPMQTLRDLFLTRWYGAEKLSLVQAATAFHVHLVDAGLTDLTESGMLDAIAVACVQHARSPVFQLTREQRIDRAHLRLARFYRHMLADGVDRHSRVAEYLVPADHVTRGVSTMRAKHGVAAGAHQEHVVPCAFIRNTALHYFGEGRSLDDVAQMTRRFLAVVDITEDERARLDDGPKALRDVMPVSWDPDAGCIYARLHEKGIVFLSGGSTECTCRPQPAAETIV